MDHVQKIFPKCKWSCFSWCKFVKNDACKEKKVLDNIDVKYQFEYLLNIRMLFMHGVNDNISV